MTALPPLAPGLVRGPQLLQDLSVKERDSCESYLQQMAVNKTSRHLYFIGFLSLPALYVNEAEGLGRASRALLNQ